MKHPCEAQVAWQICKLISDLDVLRWQPTEPSMIVSTNTAMVDFPIGEIELPVFLLCMMASPFRNNDHRNERGITNSVPINIYDNNLICLLTIKNIK